MGFVSTRQPYLEFECNQSDEKRRWQKTFETENRIEYRRQEDRALVLAETFSKNGTSVVELAATGNVDLERDGAEGRNVFRFKGDKMHGVAKIWQYRWLRKPTCKTAYYWEDAEVSMLGYFKRSLAETFGVPMKPLKKSAPALKHGEGF